MTASLTQRIPRTTTTPPVTATPAPSRRTTPVRALARVLARIGTTTLMVLAVAAFLFLAVGPRVLGYQTSTMLTGSMSPLINPGDVVLTVPTPVSALRTGDIITYNIPVEDQRVETHRVIDIIHNPDGTTAVRTKGDANNGPDPWTATLKGDTVDVHTATIPYLGTAIRTLRDPALLNALTYGAPAALVILLLTSIWRKTPDTKDTPEAGNPGHEPSRA